ncbi:MAG: hypothetical protein JWO59_3545 [Chloroflexi bacterium]|nr:hypothetical protein [Chloroflexota bacterium]
MPCLAARPCRSNVSKRTHNFARRGSELQPLRYHVSVPAASAVIRYYWLRIDKRSSRPNQDLTCLRA